MRETVRLGASSTLIVYGLMVVVGAIVGDDGMMTGGTVGAIGSAVVLALAHVGMRP